MSISSAASVLLYPLIFVGVAVASVLPAEGVFRLLGDKPSGDMRGLYTSFAAGGYKLGSKVDTGADWASGEFSVHTDTLGLRCDRDREFGVCPGDSIDVLFIGDSQGVGNGVNFENTIAGRAAICARNSQLRVANMSVGGHSMTQQLELLTWLTDVQHVKSSTYVLLVTPVMTFGCAGYTHAAVGEDGRLYDGVKTPAQMALIYLKSHAVVYSRVRNAIRNSGIGATPTRDTPFLFSAYGDGVEETSATATFADCLQRFVAFATAHDAKLALVYVPLTVEADFEPVQHAAAARGIKLDPELPARICASVAQKLNVPLHDLRPVVREFAGRGDALHLKGDYHYDAALSSACGKSICSTLARRVRSEGTSASLTSPQAWN